ncbi:MAG: tRNA preQ1(34) S-adenosylmethionine ribosyltransferase-isomerase QueA, partial [Desulfovibrionaceae bacterium]|nr:tRNA preQ1(34) S-adenosylmethionine ribosyltransferase-isomerase QueA [Desulfovibrionaceae bacterium]
PAQARDRSRLMVLDRAARATRIRTFPDLVEELPENCLVVANNSRVVPARLSGRKPSGGRIEFLLLTPLPLLEIEKTAQGRSRAVAQGLLRASKAPGPGLRLDFGPDLSVTVRERHDFGRCQVDLEWSGDLGSILERSGSMPLPPYIQRPADREDLARYQTVYARRDRSGSVAAPTAGLHFTEDIKTRLAGRGAEWVELTLYVGYGTFSPVRCPDIRGHLMHEEYVDIPEQTAAKVAQARHEGRPVLAVGTTTVRALEGAYAALGRISGFAGTTNLFITPGFEFKVVDHVLTNFHLPESSLVIMVSALAGRKNIMAAYEQALENGFRFFSYGDAMLIL